MRRVVLSSQGAQGAYAVGSETGPQVIGPDFKDGSAIPGDVKNQVLKGAADFGPALDAATLHHATKEQVADVAKNHGVDASLVRAFASGTKIFVPPGKGLSLGSLAHEVSHVHDSLNTPNYVAQDNLARIVAGSYQNNVFEIRARLHQRAVVRANP